MHDAQRTLPQTSIRTNAAITGIDWLFEPAWRGERRIAKIRGEQVALSDRHGEPVELTLSEACEVLGASVNADEAVLDGIWTVQPFLGVGSAALHLVEPPAEDGRTEEYPDPDEMEQRRAFVAIDLLELDGRALHDVPYGERRRLLESVVEETVRVRVTPAVRVPVEHWLDAWWQSGFTHYVAKRVNSRYRPGESNDDWLEIPTDRRGPGMVERLLGQRRRRGARTGDAKH